MAIDIYKIGTRKQWEDLKKKVTFPETKEGHSIEHIYHFQSYVIAEIDTILSIFDDSSILEYPTERTEEANQQHKRRSNLLEKIGITHSNNEQAFKQIEGIRETIEKMLQPRKSYRVETEIEPAKNLNTILRKWIWK